MGYQIVEGLISKLGNDIDDIQLQGALSSKISHLIFAVGHFAVRLDVFGNDLESLLEAATQRLKMKNTNRDEELDLIASKEDATLYADLKFMNEAINQCINNSPIISKCIDIIIEVVRNIMEHHDQVDE